MYFDTKMDNPEDGNEELVESKNSQDEDQVMADEHSASDEQEVQEERLRFDYSQLYLNVIEFAQAYTEEIIMILFTFFCYFGYAYLFT